MTFEVADTETVYARHQKLRKKDVGEIFEWLKTQQHLPEITELQVLLFLQTCSHDQEATRKTLENYFTLRSNSDLYKGASEELFRRVMSSFFIGFLPKQTPDGDDILLLKILDPRPEKYNCTEYAKVVQMIITLHLHQFGPTNGLIVIVDTKDTALGHLLRISLSTMKQTLQFIQEAVPTLIRRIHIVNVVPVAQRVFFLIKPFMKNELYNLIKFHLGSLESIYEDVPKECLPEEYGGELPTMKQLNEKNVQNVIDNLDFFEWHESQRVDETKRLVKTKKGFFGFFER